MGESHGDRQLLWYLVGVFGLSAVTVFLLVALFVTRVPSFTRSFVQSPAGTIRGDPVAVGLILGAGVSTLLLIGLVVVFGARYGLTEPETRSRRE